MAGRRTKRTERIEVRATKAERTLIERAAKTTGTDIERFVVAHVTEAANRVLSDRDRFELSTRAMAEWDAINARSPRVLPGLRRLFERPSPFGS